MKHFVSDCPSEDITNIEDSLGEEEVVVEDPDPTPISENKSAET